MKQIETRRSGVAGVAFVFCAAALAAGLALDFSRIAGASFWIGANPGSAAAIGAAAAVLCALAALVAGAVLGREDSDVDA